MQWSKPGYKVTGDMKLLLKAEKLLPNKELNLGLSKDCFLL